MPRVSEAEILWSEVLSANRNPIAMQMTIRARPEAILATLESSTELRSTNNPAIQSIARMHNSINTFRLKLDQEWG
jgi:hypothetical protein